MNRARFLIVVALVALFVGLQFFAGAVAGQFHDHDTGFAARMIVSVLGGAILGFFGMVAWLEYDR